MKSLKKIPWSSLAVFPLYPSCSKNINFYIFFFFKEKSKFDGVIIKLSIFVLQYSLQSIVSTWQTWVDILKNIGDTQWLPLVIFCVSFIILYSIKVHINIRFKAKLKVPIPADLIVVGQDQNMFVYQLFTIGI